jgi:AI-2 transport protein TqsA
MPARHSAQAAVPATSHSVPTQVERWERLKVACLLFIAASIFLAIAYVTREIIVPFVIAVFLNYAISPVVKKLQSSLKIPRVVSTALTVAAALLIAGLIVFLAVVSLSGAFRSLEQYHHRILHLFNESALLLNRWLLPVQVTIDPATLATSLKKLPFLAWARSVSSGVLEFFGQTILVALFFVFLVAGTRLKKPKAERPGSMSYAVNDKIARYLGVKFLTSLITGILVGAVLAILQVDLAVLFGLLTFLLNFIPSIGSIVATLLPLPVAFLQYGTGWQLVLALAIPGLIQFIIGSIMEPRIMGESLGLHPVVVLLSLLLWGFLWGIPGMLLAVPITAVLKIAFERHDITQPLARLLEGRAQ